MKLLIKRFFIFFILLSFNKLYADLDYNNIYSLNESKDKLSICLLSMSETKISCWLIDFSQVPAKYNLKSFDWDRQEYEKIKFLTYNNKNYFKLNWNFYYIDENEIQNPIILVWTSLIWVNPMLNTLYESFYNGWSVNKQDLITNSIKMNDMKNLWFKLFKNLNLEAVFKNYYFDEINNKKIYCYLTDCYLESSWSLNKYIARGKLKFNYDNAVTIPINYNLKKQFFIFNIKDDNLNSEDFTGTIVPFKDKYCEKENIEYGTINIGEPSIANQALQVDNNLDSCYVTCYPWFTYNSERKQCKPIGASCDSSKISNWFQKNEITTYLDLKNKLDKKNCFDLNLTGTFPLNINFKYKDINPSTNFILNAFDKNNLSQQVYGSIWRVYSWYTPWFSYNTNYSLLLNKPISWLKDPWGGNWLSYFTSFSGSINSSSFDIDANWMVNNDSFYCIDQNVEIENWFNYPLDNNQNLNLCSTWKIKYIQKNDNNFYWACENNTTTDSCEARLNYCSKESINNGVVTLGTPNQTNQAMQSSNPTGSCYVNCNFGYAYNTGTQTCESQPVEQCSLNWNENECSFSNWYSVKYYYQRGYDSRYYVDLYKDGVYVKNIRNQQDWRSNLSSCSSYANFTAAYYSGGSIHFLGTHIVTTNNGPWCWSLNLNAPVDFVYRVE